MVEANALKLPWLGRIAVRESTRKIRRLLRQSGEGQPTAHVLFATISYSDGYWRVSLNLEITTAVAAARANLARAARLNTPAIGADLGINSLITLSDAVGSFSAEVLPPHQVQANQAAIRRAQKTTAWPAPLRPKVGLSWVVASFVRAEICYDAWRQSREGRLPEGTSARRNPGVLDAIGPGSLTLGAAVAGLSTSEPLTITAVSLMRLAISPIDGSTSGLTQVHAAPGAARGLLPGRGTRLAGKAPCAGRFPGPWGATFALGPRHPC